MTIWLSALSAMQRLRDAGVADPVSTLTHLAEAREVRARAKWGRFDNADECQEFPQEPNVDAQSGEVLAPWPDIPADFWRWVNAGKPGAEAHGDAGVFAASVVYNPEAGEYSDMEHIKLFGVTFLADDLTAVLQGAPVSHDSPPLRPPPRSPAGRKPDLERWAEFGGALAFVANNDGLKELKSPNALYKAAADALSTSGRVPLDRRTVDMMVKHAHFWGEADAIPELPATK